MADVRVYGEENATGLHQVYDEENATIYALPQL